MLWRSGSRNTYVGRLLREEVPEDERGTPTTRGGRVGTLELEIGLTTNERERELELAKRHAGAKGGGREGKILNANRISANQSPRCVN